MRLIQDFLDELKYKRAKNSTTTVRYMFPLILGMFAILTASVVSSDKSYIKLVPSKTTVMSGESFYIDVFVNAHVPVNAIDVSVDFSSDKVEISGIDTGNSVLTIWTQEPKIENKTIRFSGGTFKRGFIGEHLIGTINVKAKYSGQTEFLVSDASLLAGDGQGSPVIVDKSNSNAKTSFYIYDQNEDPAKITANLKVVINADIDGDGNVSLRDISTFMANWSSKSTTYDFNSDGKMNFIDFSIILAKSFFDFST